MRLVFLAVGLTLVTVSAVGCTSMSALPTSSSVGMLAHKRVATPGDCPTGDTGGGMTGDPCSIVLSRPSN
jgi:hypothetical protein